MLKPTPMLPLVAAELPPAEAMATLTPMTSPLLFTRAPPELPGLMAASVWITLMEMDPLLAVLWPCPPPGGANWKPPSPPLGVVRAFLRRCR